MSNTQEQVLVQLHSACRQCYTKQQDLLASAERVSTDIKIQTVLLILNTNRIAKMDTFPTLSATQESALTDGVSQIEQSTDQTSLTTARNSLNAWISDLVGTELTAGSISLDPLTSNQLNRRMIDQLFLMKDKIRATRRRLNDNGGGYDQSAYVSARNKANLAQAVYIDQLHRDIVNASNEDVAKLEQIRYPAIESATAGSFVQSIEDLVSFIQERILAPLA